jgi:hypothetical protein
VPASINQSLKPIQGLARNRTTSLQIVESMVRTDIAIATLISSPPLLGHGSVFIVVVIVATLNDRNVHVQRQMRDPVWIERKKKRV